MLTIVTNAEEMEKLAGLWRRLHAAGDYSLFQSFEWNLAAARGFAKVEQPYVVAVMDDAGCAIVPCCVRADGSISFLGEELFDYRSTLWSGSRSCLDEAWKVVRDSGKSFEAVGVTGNAGSLQGVELSTFAAAPKVLRSGFQRGNIDGFRHASMEASHRRLQSQGFRLTKREANHSLLEKIYALKGESRNGELFRDPRRRNVAVEMGLLAGDACETFTLETSDDLVAALVTYRDHDWRRCYCTWFHPQWAEFSPGTTLLYLAIKDALENGLDCDLMTGEQPYKMRFATSTQQLYRAKMAANTKQVAEAA